MYMAINIYIAKISTSVEIAKSGYTADQKTV